jgi:hypothetical protein
MKLRFVFCLLALAAASLSASADAQVGVYFNPVVTRVGISQTDTGPFAFLGENTTSRFFGGVDMGGYWDFLHEQGFEAGVDVRDTIVHGNNAALNSFTVAARVEAHPWRHGIRPYAQLAVGAGRTKSEVSIVHVTKPEFGVFAGLDYPLGPHVDFRAVELGYGSVTTISSQLYGGLTPIPAATLFNISSGLVFRFP